MKLFIVDLHETLCFCYISQYDVNAQVDLFSLITSHRQCSDLLSQAQYHVARARKIDEEEQELRKHREEEREALRQRFNEERETRRKQKEEQEKLMMEKRQIYVEKAKNIVLEPEPEERKSSKAKVGFWMAEVSSWF